MVNVKDIPYAAKGDGKTDDTAAIQKAIDAVATKGGGIVDIPNGTYMINGLVSNGKHGLQLRDNVTIRMSSQTVLQALPNSSKWYSIFWINNVKNVNILWGTLIGERDQHIGTEGEWGFWVSIFSSQNIVVENVIAKNFWWDGFYVGKSREVATQQTENVVFYNVVADNNRRQGLSITDGKKIKVLKSVFKNTMGTVPQSGIDIEPDEAQHVSDVEISESVFENNWFHGILVEMANQPNASISNIKIHNNKVIGNRRGVRMSGVNWGSVKHNMIEGKEVSLDLRKSSDSSPYSVNISVSDNTIIGTGITNMHSSNVLSQNTFKSAVYLIGTAEVDKWLTAIVKDGDSRQNSTPSQPIQYQWYVDGQAIKGAIYGDYKLTANESWKKVHVEVKFMDDAGNLETAVSTPIFVKNSSSGSSQVAPVISPSLSSVSSSSNSRSSWGWGSLVRDYCPHGDYSPSYYDHTCGTTASSSADERTNISTFLAQDTAIRNPSESWFFNSTITDGKCYTRSSTISQVVPPHAGFSEELQKAFVFLRSYEMTKYPTLENFGANEYLTRQAAAKFFVQFAMNVLCRTPDTSHAIAYVDIDSAAPDLVPYIQLAYQLWLMKGSSQDWNRFYPHALITKAQVNAVLVRLLLNRYLDEQQTPWYTQYNQVWSLLWIFRNTAGNEPVVRSHAALMLYRAYSLPSFVQAENGSNGYVLKGH